MTKWYKRVSKLIKRGVGGGRKSTRSMPPQGEIISSASRTRPPGNDHLGAPERRQDQLAGGDDSPFGPAPSWKGITAGRPPTIEEANKIFLAYLEGDQVAAKIVDGWASRSSSRCASASAGVHDDSPAPHDPYAWQGRVWATLGRRRGLRCALLGHDDGAEVSAMYPYSHCARCGRSL